MDVYLFNAPPLPGGDQHRTPDPYCNLIEGFVEGCGEVGVNLACAHVNPYGLIVRPFAADYAAYIVQRHPNLDGAAIFSALAAHDCLSRTAFIDGLDDRFGLEWFWKHSAAVYFRNANRPHFGVATLPFGILGRYVRQTQLRPGNVVFYVCNESNHPDRLLLRRRLERGPWECAFGPLVDDDGPVVCNTRRGHQRYLRRLNECKVAINAPGGAPDCYRYWEIAASNAVLVSYPVEHCVHEFPDPPTPGVHYVAYNSVAGIHDAIAEAMDRYDELHAAQREFFLTRHRSRHRTVRVLNALGIETAGCTGDVCDQRRECLEGAV